MSVNLNTTVLASTASLPCNMRLADEQQPSGTTCQGTVARHARLKKQSSERLGGDEEVLLTCSQPSLLLKQEEWGPWGLLHGHGASRPAGRMAGVGGRPTPTPVSIP